MTWGTIEATPVALRSSDGSGRGGGADDYSAAVGPFRVRENDRREELALRMAKKAKRSLAEAALTSGRESRGSGLALDARPTPSSLHRNLLSASVRGTPSGFSPRAGGSSSATTPRADDLSPAARTLLGRTKPGRALDGGLGRSRQWGVDEGERERERKRRRAEERAREVEGRERLRRERWTVRSLFFLPFSLLLCWWAGGADNSNDYTTLCSPRPPSAWDSTRTSTSTVPGGRRNEGRSSSTTLLFYPAASRRRLPSQWS